MAARQKLMQTIVKATTRRKPSPQLREAAKKTKWNILAGDKVEVIGNHPERGKQGIVKAVLKKKDRVIVEGVNLGAKHIPADEVTGAQARTIQTERTIHYSKVNLVDPELGKPTRIYIQILNDGTRERVSKKSGAIIPRPDTFKDRTPISSFISDRDTLDEDVWELTYKPNE